SLRRSSPSSTLFPYTTLFRSPVLGQHALKLRGLVRDLLLEVFDDGRFTVDALFGGRVGIVLITRPPAPIHYAERLIVVDRRWWEIGRHTSELQSPCNLVCRLL